MATRGGPTTLFWSVAIITTTISTGFLLLVLLQRAVPATPPEAMDESMVRFFVGCLRMRPFGIEPFKSQAEKVEAVLCHDSLRLLVHHYQSSGLVMEEYIEAIKIIHNYNQTDVDIYICGLDYSRCPDRTKALKQFLTSLEMKDELRR